MGEEIEVSCMPKNPFEEASLAQCYEQWYEVGEGQRADLLEKELLTDLLVSGAQSLLEIGCGTGHFTRYFATFLPSVVGLDISPAMLQEARRLNVEHPDAIGADRRIPYLMGDALRLPFSDASFDVEGIRTSRAARVTFRGYKRV
jgi:ubiquinone/menaquinone biosynthesis C-methylase UbiE